MDSFVDQVNSFLTVANGLKILGAILILIIGRIVAGAVRGGLRKVMTKRDVDPGLIGFVCSLAYAAIIVITVIATLAKFGVQTAGFVAILGAAGFAVGFALQGSLSNFAAGVMLLIFRPFKVGDFIEAAGIAGSVKDIQVFSTTMATPDNVRITVPNAKLYGDIIKNFSGYDTRRVDLAVGIGYGSDIGKAMEVVIGCLKADDRVHKDPAPMVAVKELADSSVNLVIRGWVDGSNYWPVFFDQTRTIKESLDAAGIDIPFPQQVVYMHNEG